MAAAEAGNGARGCVTRGSLGYRLGLPAWAFPGWKGRYFHARPSPLASYATVFNAVEGNTTFYGIPDAKTVAEWGSDVKGKDFRFCFKLPRSVTHERAPALGDLKAFLRAIEPLADHLGPLLVQFPARVGPEALPAVSGLLRQLPSGTPFVLEVRHPQFFSDPALLRPLYERHDCGRVALDTRALYEGDRQHPEVLSALHRKPELPVLDHAFDERLFVRLVLHPDGQSNRRYIAQWAREVSGRIARGTEVYMMIHCPNNARCPDFARSFHDALTARAETKDLAPLEPWPIPQQGQLDLS